MRHSIRKRLGGLVVCLGLLGTLLPAAGAFDDVSDDALSEAVEVLSGLGIVSGYSDGGYHPEDILTRAQFCKLAILAEGHGDQVSASRTLFSDVPGSSWAAPYVNLAYEEGLVSGYGDGTFGPDDPVTTGQAVTIVLHLLGYTSEDIGPFWPEDYMTAASSLGLLEDISKGADETLTRGDAALHLYEMIRTDTSDGQSYLEKLSASQVEDAVLMDTQAEADDGTQDTAQVYAPQSGISYYEQESQLPESLEGRRGTLLLDNSGNAVGFVPDENAYRTLQPSETSGSGITDPAGNFYAVGNSVTVLLDGEVSTYSACWYDLEGREQVDLYYDASGSVDLVVASDAVAYDGVLLTGYYESASPNADSPDTIGLLGLELEVADSAQDDLGLLSVGSRITVALNGAGEVAAAYSVSDKKTDLYGVLDSKSSGTVTLTCGLTIQGTLTANSAGEGDLVRVTSSGIGKRSVSTVSGGSSLSLNVSAGTLGSIPLAEDIAIYERVGESTVTAIELGDILVSSVASSKIDFYDTNADGLVSVLLLDNVTGNAYTYGVLSMGQQSGGSGDLSYTNNTVSVENGDGTSETYITGKTVRDGAVGGIAVSSDGKAVDIVTLERAGTVSRSDFDGEDYVVVEGVRVPVSDQVQVYNQDTGRWTTLADAKGAAESFYVYYSGSLGEDAVVRVIYTA